MHRVILRFLSKNYFVFFFWIMQIVLFRVLNARGKKVSKSDTNGTRRGVFVGGYKGATRRVFQLLFLRFFSFLPGGDIVGLDDDRFRLCTQN